MGSETDQEENAQNATLINFIENLPVIPPSPSTNTLPSTSSDSSVLSCADFDTVANLDIAFVLRQNIIGKSILQKIGKRTRLDARDQNNVAEIIISYFLNKNLKLNNVYLSILADKISLALPSEKRSTYYVSPIPKKKSRLNKPEVARGKLVDKHRNKLTAIRRSLIFTNDTDLEKDVCSTGKTSISLIGNT